VLPNRDEAGQLAHDLNNLLAVIGGHTDALEYALPAEGPDHESIVAIQRAVRSGAALADQVRKLGRPAPALVRGTDVQPVLETMSSDATRRFGHRIAVAVHAAPRLWSASVAPTLIDQALWHLMTRAVDVMPHGGTLNVRCMNVELVRAEAGFFHFL
jgi:signal transduction histidine kinase